MFSGCPRPVYLSSQIWRLSCVMKSTSAVLVSSTSQPPLWLEPRHMVWSGLQPFKDPHETSIQKWARGLPVMLDTSSDEWSDRLIWFLGVRSDRLFGVQSYTVFMQAIVLPLGGNNNAFSEVPGCDKVLLVTSSIGSCHRNFQQKFSCTAFTPGSLASCRLCKHLTPCNKFFLICLNQAEWMLLSATILLTHTLRFYRSLSLSITAPGLRRSSREY